MLVVLFLFPPARVCLRSKSMPVNIFAIPEKVKENGKPPSLWRWFFNLLFILVIYISVFLVFFPQFLSKNVYIFWLELLFVPLLLWGVAISFRLLLWNGKKLETTYWNATQENYYQDMLKKGRTHLELIDVKIRLPDVEGEVTNKIHDSLLPVRYTPTFTHMSRYLAFSTPVYNSNEKEQGVERSQFLFEKMMPELLENIHMHMSLLPSSVGLKIICMLSEELIPKLEEFWHDRCQPIFPFSNIVFSKNISESLDSWLDERTSEYLILIASAFHGDELLVDNKSESMIFLMGKRSEQHANTQASFGALYRPELGWDGLDKSLLWGGISQDKKLSGVVYSGLDENEKNSLVLKTSNLMSNNALTSFNYINTNDYFCCCEPLTAFLQVEYVRACLEPGFYLIVNKSDDCLTTFLFDFTAGDRDKV